MGSVGLGSGEASNLLLLLVVSFRPRRWHKVLGFGSVSPKPHVKSLVPS